MVNGVVVSAMPTFSPSIRSCTPATGLSGSVVLMLKATVPDSTAPAAGALIDTTGGVVSDEGGEAPRSASSCMIHDPDTSRGALAEQLPVAVAKRASRMLPSGP